jgi:multicomponent Na+:H+ antiporter subunit C
MTEAGLYALSGIALFGIGFHAVVVHSHRLRKVLAVNVMGSGVFLVLVALAHRTPHAAPDPVPHAMVLTGVVVAVSATAVALSLVRRIHGDPSGANGWENSKEAPP